MFPTKRSHQRLTRRRGWRAVAGAVLLVLCACNADVLIEVDGGAAGDGGGAAASGGGSAVGGSDGGSDFLAGGFGSGGVETTPWDHQCASTGIEVDADVFDEVCPEDYWSAQHWDGATAYETYAGAHPFAGRTTLYACAADGRRLELDIHIDIGGPGDALVSGSYVEPAGAFELVTGTLTIAEPGDIGEVIAGSYEATFGPAMGSGEAILASGDFRVCHIPERALP